jgi:uncharacterized membrane protein
VTHGEAPERRRGLLHPGLVASSATLLIATFVSDVLYWQTLLFQWNNVSEWLLAAGLLFAGLAAIAFVIDLALRRFRKVAWLRFAGLTIAALLCSSMRSSIAAMAIPRWFRKASSCRRS